MRYITRRKIHRELESNLGVQASKYVQSLLWPANACSYKDSVAIGRDNMVRYK